MEELAVYDNYQELHDYIGGYAKKYDNNNYEQYLTSIKDKIHKREAETKELTTALRNLADDALNPGDVICVNEW